MVGWRNEVSPSITKIIFEGSQKLVAAIFSDDNYFIKITDQNTDSVKFVEFINDLAKYIKLKEYYDGKKFWWIADNASYHKSKEAVSALEEKFYGVCFIPPYSPQFAVIELFFNIIKSRIKLIVFEEAQKLDSKEAKKMVSEVIHGVTQQSVISWFRHVFRNMAELFKIDLKKYIKLLIILISMRDFHNNNKLFNTVSIAIC